MKIRNLLLITVIIAVISLIIYRISENKSKAPQNKPDTGSIEVGGIIIQPQRFDDNLSLSGSLEANESVEIRSEFSGIVENINFQEGAKVPEGKVLVQINDVELRAQLSKVKTAENLSAENARRAKLLWDKEAISKEEYDVTTANYSSAKAESQLIAAQLSKATIRAPFSGTIGLRNISKGAYVTPTTIIAKLVNTDQLKLTFSIPEKYASLLNTEQPFYFTTSNSDQKYEAKIYAIDPDVDLATRTLKARAIVNNEKQQLYPGMFVNVILSLETVPNAIMVPTEALIPIQNGKQVFITQDGKAKAVEVKTGSRSEKSVRITAGLKPGDTLLTYGVMALNDGTPVTVSLKTKDSISN